MDGAQQDGNVKNRVSRLYDVILGGLHSISLPVSLPKIVLKSDFYYLKIRQTATYVSRNMCSKFIRSWNSIALKRQINTDCTWKLCKIGNETTTETKTYTVILLLFL